MSATAGVRIGIALAPERLHPNGTFDGDPNGTFDGDPNGTFDGERI